MTLLFGIASKNFFHHTTSKFIYMNVIAFYRNLIVFFSM